jgi:hypothetical protein
MPTKVSAALPDLILPPGATITVELDDASAVVTQLNVYGFTPAGDPFTETVVIPPLFVYGPNT